MNIWIALAIFYVVFFLLVILTWLRSKRPKQQKKFRVIYVYLERNGERYRFVGKDIYGRILMDEKGKEILLTKYFEPINGIIGPEYIARAELHFQDENPNNTIIMMVDKDGRPKN